jgi:uncharacterized protein YndB with AHSA1/START domain
MIEVRRRIEATPDQVFEVLSDGWTYPSWVVGASRMRAVEDGFPATGTRLHHSVGTWPALIDDSTWVITCVPPQRLVLGARAWPAGEATVDLELQPDGSGTLVIMREDASAGPAKLMPKPLRAVGLVARNRESLRRLAYLAEHRSTPEKN